jgi:two-component system sensor histidine kinase AlgZ
MSDSSLQSGLTQANTQYAVSAAQLIPELCQGRAVLGLIMFSEALVLVLMLLSNGLLDFSWEPFAVLSFYVQWSVLISAAVLCRLRQHVHTQNLNAVLFISFMALVLINLLISVLAAWASERFFLQDLGLDWLLKNQLTTMIIAALVLHYFYVQWVGRMRAKSESQARVQALQSRIRPHFLFNSMNIIASLIHIDPDKAEQAVEDLSELFRASLKEAGSETSLETEIQLCKKYISIEKLRLAERLEVEWFLAKGLSTSTIKIPQLTIQPLIENAIYHGIAPNPDGGTVEIYIDSQLEKGPKNNKWKNTLQVKNPVYQQTLGTRHENGNQMALKNIRHRLEVLYGEDVRLATEQDGQFFILTIEYFQRSANTASLNTPLAKQEKPL